MRVGGLCHRSKNRECTCTCLWMSLVDIHVNMFTSAQGKVLEADVFATLSGPTGLRLSQGHATCTSMLTPNGSKPQTYGDPFKMVEKPLYGPALTTVGRVDDTAPTIFCNPVLYQSVSFCFST